MDEARRKRGKASRVAGQKWEREVVKDLNEIVDEEITTSRLSSRALDNRKIDIHGMPLFDIQCKVIGSNSIDTRELYKIESKEFPIVAAMMRLKKGKTFRTQRKVILMDYNDFLEILKQYVFVKTEADNTLGE